MTGNLTKDPELRTTQSGDAVCTFTIAVNRRHKNRAQAGQQEADYFRITAWRQLGENAAKWLIKGKKVTVVGPVSCRTYQGNDGKTYASMEVTADDIEYLSPANTVPGEKPVQQTQNESIGENKRYKPGEVPAQPSGGGFTQVDEEELPF